MASSSPRGASFGPYRLNAELGRGTAGVVFDALDTRLDRRVALKLVRADGASPSRLERFKREGQIQARLAHPNVVRVFETGFEQGHLFLAMELVKGTSLRDELTRRGTLPAGEALELIAAIARGVHAAHAAGVVHRDLKPENVLLDEHRTPRVTDFGVAKETGADTMKLSRTGQLLGTPLYMAPEQVRGEHAAVTARTDVWALGAMLFELVTGEPPFSSTEMVTLLARIEAAPPRAVALRDARARAAVAVALRALEKEPSRRFASAEELALACEKALRAPAARSASLAPLAALLGGALGLAVALRAVPPPVARAERSAPRVIETHAGESHAAPPRMTLACVATISHGRVATGRVAVAGETILASAAGGGPVSAFLLDGTCVGSADGAWATFDRSVAASGACATWATSGGFAIARTGVVGRVAQPSRVAPLAVGGGVIAGHEDGELVVLDTRTDTLRRIAIPFRPYAITVSEDGAWCGLVGVVEDKASACLVSLAAPSPETTRFYSVRAKEGPIAFVDGCFAHEENVEGWPVVLHDLPPERDRARRIPLQDWGVVAAIAPGPAGLVAIARHGNPSAPHDLVQVYSLAEGADYRTGVDVGDTIVSLAWTRDGERLVVGRLARAALVLRVALGPRDIPELVRALHVQELGAEPDAAGLANWVGHARHQKRVVGDSWHTLRVHLLALMGQEKVAQERHRAGLVSKTFDDALEVEHELAGPEVVTAALFLDAAGERVATGSLDGTARVWETSSERLAWSSMPREDAAAIRALACTERGSDGMRILAAMEGSSDRGSALRVLADAGERSVHPPFALTTPGARFDVWALSPTGERAIAGSTVHGEQRLAFLPLPDGPTADVFFTAPHARDLGAVRALAFLPDGSGIVSALAGGGLVVERGATHERQRLETPPLRSLSVAPDGRAILGVAVDGRLVVASLADRAVEVQPERVRAAAFSPDGLLVAALLPSGELEVRDRSSREVLARARGLAVGLDVATAPPLAWSDDGRRILAGAGPVSVLALDRGAIEPAALAHLEALLAEARAAAGRSKRTEWSLVRAVASAPWDLPVTVAARDKEPALRAWARWEAWDTLADLLGPGDGAVARVRAQAHDWKQRARR